MKMGTTIECPPSPFNNVSNDPLKEAITEFGTGENKVVEQRSENLTEEDIMRLIRDKINYIKVDLENPAIAVDEIIEYLEEEGVEISKDLEKYTEFAISEKTNFLQYLERLGINRDNPTKEEIKKLKEMAIRDAEWIGNVVEYIRENKDNPKEIKNFWKEYDKTFLSFKEHENNKDFTKGYNIKEGPEVVKRGILTEVAAMDLLEEIANDFEKCKKVKIEYSTSEQDVYDKIDFFLVVTFKNGKVKKIPVQVKSCDISNFANRGSNKKELERKIQFVLDNVINTNKTGKNVLINQEYKYQTRAKKRMDEFFNVSKNINKDGFFIILPYGEINPKFLNPQDKSGKATESCIDKKGVPSEALRDHFLFESQTIKNIEADIIN